MRRRLMTTATTLLLAATACASDPSQDQPGAAATATEQSAAPIEPVEVPTELVDPEGSVIGTAWFRDARNGTEVEVQVAGLPEGFHGMHLHEVGTCDTGQAPPTGDAAQTEAFASAGEHIGSDQTAHGDHAGDLPALRVIEGGVGSLTALVGPMSLEDLLDRDGTTLIIHEAADNLANIPPRYAPEGPDGETLTSGDSGPRVACGAIGG